MKTRIISGAALIVIFAALLVMGGPVLLVALLALTLIGLNEFYTVISSSNQHQPFRYVGMAVAACLYICLLFFKEQLWSTNLMMYLITIMMILVMGLCIATYPKRSVTDAALTIFGVIYVAVLFGYVYLLRTVPNGQFYVWYIFAASWGCDTCAYFCGYFLGKHKLAPVLSPKKTIEGAVGGVIGAILLCVIFGMVIAEPTGIDRGVLLKVSLVVGLLGSIVAQVGDIFASSIKRKMKIKDYGKLIPGHGGVLDRFDSLLLVAPVIVMTLEIFQVI